MSLKKSSTLSKTSGLVLSLPPSSPRVTAHLVKFPNHHGSNNALVPTTTRSMSSSTIRASVSRREFTTTPPSRFSEYGEWDPSSPLNKPFNPSWAAFPSSAQPSSSKTPVVISHGGRWSTRGGVFNPRLALDKDIVAAVMASPVDHMRVAAVVQGGRYNVDKWPNAEDVEGIALVVEWVDSGKDVKVLREEDGGEKIEVTEKIVVKDMELWEDATEVAVS